MTDCSDTVKKLACKNNLQRQCRKLHFLDFQGIIIKDAWDPESCDWHERHIPMSTSQMQRNAELRMVDDIWQSMRETVATSSKASSPAGPCQPDTRASSVASNASSPAGPCQPDSRWLNATSKSSSPAWQSQPSASDSGPPTKKQFHHRRRLQHGS